MATDDFSKIKPNFFIIGAAKSGTTALSEYLREHPNVFFCDPKEPGYFAEDFKSRAIVKESHYLKLFQRANPQQHLARGEGSVIYLMSKIAVEKILQFQPNAKFIVMIRNPVDMVISLHAQRLKDGLEVFPRFLDAWEAEQERKYGNKIPASCIESKDLYYSEWGQLGTQLKQVLKVVPHNQVKIILFDDFKENTSSVYKDVLTFLRLPNDLRTSFPRINERRYPRSLWVVYSIRYVMRFWEPLRKKMGYKGTGLATKIIQWNSTPLKKLVNLKERLLLTEFYQNEIKILENLLNRDLSDWSNL